MARHGGRAAVHGLRPPAAFRGRRAPVADHERAARALHACAAATLGGRCASVARDLRASRAAAACSPAAFPAGSDGMETHDLLA